MKIKFLTLLLCGFTMMLLSCSDDDGDKLSNEFILNAEDYDLNMGFYNVNQETIGEETIYEWNIFLQGFDDDSEDEEHYFSFSLYTLDEDSPNGTYTYSQNEGETGKFNGSFSSFVPQGHDLQTDNIKNGTVKITKSGDTFNITFDIVYLFGEDEVRVKGAMKGSFAQAAS